MEPSSHQHRDALHAYDPARGEPPTAAAAQGAEAAMADSTLRAFWEAEQAFDRAFSVKMAQVPVPAGLRERILKAAAGEQRVRAGEPAVTPTAYPRNRNTWHWSAFAGAAAAVMLIALLYAFVVNPFAERTSPELKAMVARLEAALDERSVPMQRGEDYSQLVKYLETGGAPVPKFIPAGFSKENGIACANYEIDGVPVGMMCFRVEDGLYHIFTVDRANMPNQPDLPSEVISHVGEHCCATWTREDQLYILATTEPESKLLTLL